MPIEPPSSFLAGQLLLAMPNIGDPRFHRAVIFICAHDDKGAMGLMLTQPVPGMTLGTLLQQLGIARSENGSLDYPVFSGGPVENGRGFVLHSGEFHQKETVVVNDSFAVTATIDALHAIAKHEGPDKLLFALGYAGWQQGQLEQELADNAWLNMPADPRLIFDIPASEKWDVAMHQIGVNPSNLTGVSGRA
jgi:putative transcriptional regulator